MARLTKIILTFLIVMFSFQAQAKNPPPGTGTSDSIPALLSDGEFVFTAKAVKNIGIDKLRKMMSQAEEAYDAGMTDQVETAEAAEIDSTLG